VGSDFTSTFSPGCSLTCAAALKASPAPIAAASTALVVFTFIFSSLRCQTVVEKNYLANHYNFVMIARNLQGLTVALVSAAAEVDRPQPEWSRLRLPFRSTCGTLC